MRPLILLATALCLVQPLSAAERNDKTRKPVDTILLSDPAQGRTIGKVGGDPVLLQSTPNGTVGKLGKDKVMLHKDGHGNTLGKVGDRKLFCHTDPATGLTLCK